MSRARVLILGGGQQGSVIARDLASDHAVTVADQRSVELVGVRSVLTDLSDSAALEALIAEHDLAVGALPAALGFQAAQAAVIAGRSYVDVAFYAEDAHELDAAARAAGVAVLPDCGLAPGISNLLVGRALSRSPATSVRIDVGGIATDPSRPYGYRTTWSLPDLVDEYTRPARILREGKTLELPAFSEPELLDFPGVGRLESFLTDGLRTLLRLDGVQDMVERTLRWPGHMEAVQPLLAEARLVEEFDAKCREGDDLVALRIEIDGELVTMTERARDGLSAMARTTALTTAAFARWVASGRLAETGVVTPEQLGRDPEAYAFILKALRSHGIRFEPAEPFAITS